MKNNRVIMNKNTKIVSIADGLEFLDIFGIIAGATGSFPVGILSMDER